MSVSGGMKCFLSSIGRTGWKNTPESRLARICFKLPASNTPRAGCSDAFQTPSRTVGAEPWPLRGKPLKPKRRSVRHDVGLWEHFSHVLAGYCGINAAQTRVMDSGGAYHILLSRRFDRTADGRRIHFASALTHLGFKDGAGASDGKGYLDIVDFILQACPDTIKNLEELFRRVAFYICLGNGDDHFRNHGFILGPKGWALSPAYDINPSLSMEQSLMISETTNESSLEALTEAHDSYFLPKQRAESIIEEVRTGMKRWPSLAKRLHIPPSEAALFEARLNRFL